MSDDRDQRVKERAYEIWEREGRPTGEHDQHWDRARRELDDQDQGRTPAAVGETVKSAAKRGATKRATGASARKTAGGAAGKPTESKARGRAKSKA